MDQPETWSYSTGRRGVSRVRVYERYPGGPLQVEFTGADRQTLTNLAGQPVTDRVLATKIADRLRDRLQEGSSKRVAREALGIPEARTLRELLTRYHGDLEPEWSEGHTRTQRHLRDWWLGRLGATTELRRINEATVEREIRLATDARKWSNRTRQKYLRYIMAAYRYARLKLKWIREDDALTGVTVPKPKRGGPSYSHAELLKLLKAAPDVDVRVWAALEVAYDTQARSRALLHLRAEDYGVGLLTFRAKYDKAKTERVAVLSPSARRAVESAIASSPGPWLLMEAGRRMTYDELLGGLRATEKAAGVPYVSGRGWHAVKRRAVTDARRAVGDMGAVSKQSGTLASTLERIYDQDDLEPKQAVADAMERLRHGG